MIVQKYGGTSVGDVDRIRAVADRVASAREGGYDVCVVVSAMGDTTDDLTRMAHALTPVPQPRELDMLLTSGERIAMSLLAIAINAKGCKAASYTGSQAGIITTTEHGKAKIVDVRPGRIKEALAAGNVVIVAGFQGVSTSLDVTTLGRGGSDTTGVALAAALGAEFCEIFTDVDGVYTTDPRICPDARRLDSISYEEMLEMAASGAKVLQLRSVEYARRHGVRVHVRSSFTGEPGTWVQDEGTEGMEQALISGVALDDTEAKITIEEVPDRPGVAANIFKAVADESINVDMIVQNVSHSGTTDMSFTAPRADLPKLEDVLDRIVKEIGAARFVVDGGIAKISLIGAGMKSHPGVAADMFQVLAAEQVNIEMISTSSIRISCVIRSDDAERAVRAVHDHFELGDRRRVGRARRRGLMGRTVAVVGATGAVGRRITAILEERDFAVDTLLPLASSRSAGSKLAFRRRGDRGPRADATEPGRRRHRPRLGRRERVEAIPPRSCRRGCDLHRQLERVPMDDDVPLSVPEVNPEALEGSPTLDRRSQLHHDHRGASARAAASRRGTHEPGVRATSR